MTQEEIQLLFKDLCARLPYGTIVCDKNNPTSVGKLVSLDMQNKFATFEVDEQTGELYTCPTEFVIPYLRPMSSMTREELNTYARLVGSVSYSLSLEKIVNYKKVDMDDFTFLSNWLNKNMFDYRGLIPMGLALEALEGMYDTKTASK